MYAQLAKKMVKVYLVNDIRGIAIMLLGTCIYLLLFSTFGHPEISSISLQPTDFFPRKLWQTWKVDAANFDEGMAQHVRTWTKKNPTLRHEVLTDSNALAYVRQTYGPQGFNRPDVVQTYEGLAATILKADLLRYLIMYAEGGIYADVDVEPIAPFEDWIPRHFREQDLDMIIGIETDEPDFKDHRLLGVKAQSFCQWTFACKRRTPAVLRLINNILHWLNETKKAQKQEQLQHLKFDFDAVLNITGPSAFTSAMLADMSASSGRTVEWTDFHGLRDAKVVGRILVLPAQAFAGATGHSGSGSHKAMGALVEHHFGASGWTKDHQRYKHPAFGSVERCNWNPECVKLWDANTAMFDALSQQEQLDFLAVLQAQETAETQQAEQDSSKTGESQEKSQDTQTGKDVDQVDELHSQDDQESKPTESIDDASIISTEDAGETAPTEDVSEVDVDTGTEQVVDQPISEDIKYNIPDIETLEEMLMQD